MARRQFCELGPAAYRIAVNKEILYRDVKNLINSDNLAKEHRKAKLPVIVKSHTSIVVRKLAGVDISLQENKQTNIILASRKISGIVIKPGETFSFWKLVGRPSASAGYKDGLVIASQGKLTSGVGGGLCQMANMVHWLVLNSPLTVTELHHHSDALFPDEKRRVPFGTGTSVFYNYVDYRFKNTTDQEVQIVVWVEDGELCGELRSEREFPYRYKLVEENHHFRKEGDDYYRISQVYRLVIDKATNEQIRKELILDNHSRVMYDHKLIPEDQIRND